MSKLIIVESPTKTKTIKSYLGKDYDVVASMGHVRDLPAAKLNVDVKNNFEPKYAVIKGKENLVRELKADVEAADEVYLATDPDREGEAISWHLATLLGLDMNEANRVTFNEITKTGIMNGIAHPHKIDMDLVNAQQARRILDRLVGYRLSPFVSQKIRRGLSAGRVQSVAVRLIVDREEEIRAFSPEEYWTLDAKFIPQSARKAFSASFVGDETGKVKIENKEQSDKYLKRLENAAYTVSSVKKGTRKKQPAPPFITSTLQQDASRRLGFQAKRTMKVAQELYEGVNVGGHGQTGLITYMRTDSLRISEEARAMTDAYIRETYGDKYVPEKPRYFKSRNNAQDAHEAIRPTNVALTPEEAKSSLTTDQYKLYKLIYERFIASQMTEAKLETTTVSFDANGCTYRATGTKVLFPGYTAIYTEGRDDSAEEEAAIPTVSANDIFRAEKVEKEQKFSQPPARYTEASLVKLLEEKGIGRPSTYAPTISTIIERGYVRREKKQLVPTELGFVVTKIMKENFSDIVDIKFTADMESKLDLIKDGEEPWKEVIREFYGPFEKTLEKASESIEKVVIPDEVSDVKCEKCGSMMVYKMGRFGKFLACPNFPNCRNTKAIVEKTDVKCPLCGGEIIKRKSKKGKVFYGCEKYPECSFVSWDKPVKEKCPKCGGLMVHKMGHGGGFDVCIAEGCGYTTKQNKQDKKGSEE